MREVEGIQVNPCTSVDRSDESKYHIAPLSEEKPLQDTSNQLHVT